MAEPSPIASPLPPPPASAPQPAAPIPPQTTPEPTAVPEPMPAPAEHLIGGDAPISPAKPGRVFTERAVPTSPIARVWGFGSLAAGMAAGAVAETARRVVGSANRGTGSVVMSHANAERLANALCRMRGAALKLGQMLSIQDESMLPAEIAEALERVRSNADVMPKAQLHTMLQQELGDDWRTLFKEWDDTPVAAASIGQVHKAVLHDGRVVAVKVQYPGVAESIDSDLRNLERVLVMSAALPKGLHLDSALAVARVELKRECDYEYEASAQAQFQKLVSGDPDFVVPDVVWEACSKRVLTTTWLDGEPIDALVCAPQQRRNDVARRLLKLCLLEIFEWRFAQTDPNYANFMALPDGRIGLLDFGAARAYKKAFTDEYLNLVWSAAMDDHAEIMASSARLGFLRGSESDAMREAHLKSGLAVGEPFMSPEPYDFGKSKLTARISEHGAVLAHERHAPPPPEVYSLHRKLAGCYFLCIRMGAVMPCRDLLEQTVAVYDWPEGRRPAGVPTLSQAQGSLSLRSAVANAPGGSAGRP